MRQKLEATRARSRGPYFWLAALFVLVVLNQGLYTLDVIRDARKQYPSNTIRMGNPWPAIVEVNSAAEQAGLRKGDRVTAIDGEYPQGEMQLASAIHRKSPGEFLTVTVDRDGRTTDIRVEILNMHLAGDRWLYTAIMWVVIPWLCIVLAFWVAALRPYDLSAWAVLGILNGMGGLGRAGYFNQLGWGWPGLIAQVFHELASLYGWGICMMLFGLYFPQRWEFERKFPWVKWVFIGGACVLALLSGFSMTGEALAWVPTLTLRSALAVPDWVSLALTMVMHSFFFFGLSIKLGNPAMPRDDRRRIRLLYTGCGVAMGPMFLLILFDAVVHHRMPGDPDGQLVMIATSLMFGMPLTMAYVIVVERAMDVRMAIRQGVQYALARRGIKVIQVVLTVAIVLLAANAIDAQTVTRAQKITLIAVGVAVILKLRDAGEYLRRWVDRRFFREAYNAEKILSDLSEQVRSILEKDRLIETVTQKLSESLHVERVAVLLQEGLFFRPAFATGYGAPLEVAIGGETPVMNELRTMREPLAVDQRDAAQGEEGLERLDAHFLLPLASKKELLGFISLGPKKSEEPYTASDTSLLRTVAVQTGMALENARLSEAIAEEVTQRELLHREIEIAREVQERLFPQNLPSVPALEYAGHCRPARGVGGDYYDFLALTNGRLGLAIGDVSGKGVPAALLMASLQASVRGQSQGQTSGGLPDIAGLMANVNQLVFDASPQNRYATFFYAQFHPTTRSLVYTNGGHNAPMLLRGGEVVRLEVGGPPVGLFRIARYEQAEVQLQAGDLLILYTDGISEAENPGEEEWGEDALVAAARACGGLPPVEMIARIMAAADAFASGAPQHDDMTLVVARVLAG